MAIVLIPGAGFADDAATGTTQLPGAGFLIGPAAGGGGGGDTTPPALTLPTGTATGATTATVGATTDEANGTLYAVVTTSATAPTAAQVKAGQDHTGAAAVWAGSQAVASTGAKTLSATGLTASTTYYAHLMHEDAAANRSAVVSSASFATSAAATPTLTIPITNNTGTALASTNIAKVTVMPLASMGTVALALINQATDASGNLAISNAALTAGVGYVVALASADGAQLGIYYGVAA